MSLSIRQLKVFESTARLEKLTFAAEEQALSQSAASQSLKELEQAIGFPLFTRVGRELQITDKGLEILPKVRQIMLLIEEIEHPSKGELSGTLRIAASVTIACYLLPQLTAQFMVAHPEVIPEIMIGNTGTVISQLEKGQAQIGLIEGPASPAKLTITPWLEDDLALFCHPTHPLAKSGFITLDEFPNYRWILREAGSGTRNVFDQAVQKAGGSVGQSLAMNRQEAIKQSVRSDLGIGCLSRLSIREDIQSGKLVELASPLDLSRRFSIVTQASNHPLAEAFAEMLRQ
ncbi:LysR substrate-binding domain-containing protein [uncultured Neptuniibacter sp.]|uniref:LysR substrate-binding domain-containing protein n=1 Tax=uncultured Neptuniibacter sp. TaxID=502143 RepID=UPI00261DF457|nr:LysR substrate-binding domain-containing protein [uncultured Neptuniibacter sp.]